MIDIKEIPIFIISYNRMKDLKKNHNIFRKQRV